MNVQLFNPPVHHYAGVHYKMNPGLGLPILAAVLQNAGYRASVLDLEALLVSPEQLALQFRAKPERWPDAVGFTVTTHNARGARECVKALRDAGYRGYVMLGGPHITLLARQEDKPADLWGADVWVAGECEGNVASIVEARPKGIVQGEQVAMSRIPAPAWHSHRPMPTEYMGNQPKIGHPEGISMWSRGCPHMCTFCGNPVFNKQRIRTRPAEHIAAEMAQLKALGVKAVFVYDDELVGVYSQGHPEWLAGVCKEIEPLGLVWKCQGRCSTKLELAELQGMYAAGCRAIMWGVESFSQPVLTAMRKGTTEADIWHTLRTAKQAGIGNWLFMMVGNYAETGTHLAYTEQQLAKATEGGLVQWRQVTVCTPVLGSPLYETAKAEGWLKESPEAGPQMHQVYNATPWLSERELRHWVGRLERAGL